MADYMTSGDTINVQIPRIDQKIVPQRCNGPQTPVIASPADSHQARSTLTRDLALFRVIAVTISPLVYNIILDQLPPININNIDLKLNPAALIRR